ncbi:hypothetical protein [Schumannella soli]|uniref:DUF3168 domain-containing protein n=1 Tax=Schumannella soli TaxID=2590779 RepID=A0A506Y1J4_9MICO|nr:hypothetical protein [Schumannella soli]TPW75895.1 hypothetical protein FJ657_08590 [Schumannella soli]
MSLRSHVADALRTHLPKAWTVRPYRYSIDQTRAPVVMLATTRIEKAEGEKGRNVHLHDDALTLTVFVPEIAPEKRYDAIETAVDKVIAAIEQMQLGGQLVRWDAASFDVEDNYTAADITLTVRTRHNYPKKEA